MTLAVWDPTWKPLHPYGVERAKPMVVARMSGGTEQRAATLSRDLLTYNLSVRVVTSVKNAIAAFFLARGQTIESFLLKDWDEYSRTGITLDPAVGNGVVTAFSVPKTGPYGGDYPIDQVATLLKVAGVSVTRTVQTDARTLTAAVAPGASAITADYEYYRRVKLDSPFEWTHSPYGVWSASFRLAEVPTT